MRKRSRLLIRGTNWIGDSVMTLPALRLLRREQPEWEITLMTRPWVRALFESQPFIDRIIDAGHAGSPGGSFGHDTDLMRRGDYDAILILPNALGPALQAFVAGIPRRIGYRTDGRSLFLTDRIAKPAFGGRQHQIWHYLHLLATADLIRTATLAGTAVESLARLDWRDSEAELAAATLRRLGISGQTPLVGIHAGASYGSAKRWFPERFAAVADALIASTHAEIALLGAAAEADLAQAISAQMKSPAHVLAGKTDLRELLQLIRSCCLLLSNDSGPMHLAAALGVPQVALFGSTNAIATGPLNPQSAVLRKEVACSPCLLRECPVDLRCFARISVEEVVEACKEQIHCQRKARLSSL